MKQNNYTNINTHASQSCAKVICESNCTNQVSPYHDLLAKYLAVHGPKDSVSLTHNTRACPLLHNSTCSSQNIS